MVQLRAAAQRTADRVMRSVLAFSLGAAVVAVAVAPPRAQAVTEPTTIGVSAHRGGAGQWPENSAKAFRGSVAAGYDMIEADVQFTSDLVPVMSHDDTLPSRCSYSGEKIHSMSYARVQKVRCSGEPLPTLTQTMAIIKDSGTLLKLEVKAYSGQSTSSKQKYAGEATKHLIKGGMIGQSLIHTFEWQVMLPVVRKLVPSLPFIALETKPSLYRARVAAAAGVTLYAPPVSKANEFLLTYAKSLGMRVGLWDTTTVADRKYALDLGVNPLSSDYPEALRTWLQTPVAELLATKRVVTTTRSAYTLDSTTYDVNEPRKLTVMGTAVPSSRIKALRTVTLKLAVSSGTGVGSIDVSPYSSGKVIKGVRVAMPKGSATLTVRVSPGDSGKVRIVALGSKVKLKVQVVAYTNLVY